MQAVNGHVDNIANFLNQIIFTEIQANPDLCSGALLNILKDKKCQDPAKKISLMFDKLIEERQSKNTNGNQQLWVLLDHQQATRIANSIHDWFVDCLDVNREKMLNRKIEADEDADVHVWNIADSEFDESYLLRHDQSFEDIISRHLQKVNVEKKNVKFVMMRYNFNQKRANSDAIYGQEIFGDKNVYELQFRSHIDSLVCLNCEIWGVVQDENGDVCNYGVSAGESVYTVLEHYLQSKRIGRDTLRFFLEYVSKQTEIKFVESKKQTAKINKPFKIIAIVVPSYKTQEDIANKIGDELIMQEENEKKRMKEKQLTKKKKRKINRQKKSLLKHEQDDICEAVESLTLLGKIPVDNTVESSEKCPNVSVVTVPQKIEDEDEFFGCCGEDHDAHMTEETIPTPDTEHGDYTSEVFDILNEENISHVKHTDRRRVEKVDGDDSELQTPKVEQESEKIAQEEHLCVDDPHIHQENSCIELEEKTTEEKIPQQEHSCVDHGNKKENSCIKLQENSTEEKIPQQEHSRVDDQNNSKENSCIELEKNSTEKEIGLEECISFHHDSKDIAETDTSQKEDIRLRNETPEQPLNTAHNETISEQEFSKNVPKESWTPTRFVNDYMSMVQKMVLNGKQTYIRYIFSDDFYHVAKEHIWNQYHFPPSEELIMNIRENSLKEWEWSCHTMLTNKLIEVSQYVYFQQLHNHDLGNPIIFFQQKNCVRSEECMDEKLEAS